jgi:hypothetical protein
MSDYVKTAIGGQLSAFISDVNTNPKSAKSDKMHAGYIAMRLSWEACGSALIVLIARHGE